MLHARSRRKSLGFTMLEVLTVTSIMASLHSQGNYQYAINKANEIKGVSNLKQIHQLLMIQTITGGMPDAAFYPKDDPKKDPRSIVNLIQGAPQQLFVSPFAPAALQEKGLTFAWNDAVNGKGMDSVPSNTWLLIDLAAFVADPKIPKPTKYLILYANGKAEAVSNLPPDIAKAVEEAKAKAKGAETKPKGDKKKPTQPQSKRPAGTLPASPNKRIPGIGNLPIPPAVPGL
jgi:type II secretory pathway pseudopilin PulG